MNETANKTSDSSYTNFKSILPCLLVHDIQKTISFYKNYLNFNVKKATKNFGLVERGDIKIEFRKSDKVQVDNECEYNERRHLEIMVEDLDHLYHEFNLNGVRILWGPHDLPNTKRTLEIEDCNGYILMFTEDNRG